MSIKSEYKRLRENYLRRLRRFLKEGYDLEGFKPQIPKTITQGSINRIAKLNQKLSEAVKSQGYYNKQREKRQLRQALTNKQVLKNIEQKQEARKFKQPERYIPTNKARDVQDSIGTDTTKVPNLNDVILNEFEQQISNAKTYIGNPKKAKYQQAVNKAGQEAENLLNQKIDSLINRYRSDIENADDVVRDAIAKKLENEAFNLHNQVDQFLFEFISDGAGSLEHTSLGIEALQNFLSKVDVNITVGDKKEIAQMADASVTGDAINISDVYDF